MKIHVRLFAAARQLAHCDTLEVDCPDGATVADVRQAVAAACPMLAPLLANIRIAVNAQYAPDEQPVNVDDQIACIPPVSGG